MKRLAIALLILIGPAAADEALEARSLLDGKVTAAGPRRLHGHER